MIIFRCVRVILMKINNHCIYNFDPIQFGMVILESQEKIERKSSSQMTSFWWRLNTKCSKDLFYDTKHRPTLHQMFLCIDIHISLILVFVGCDRQPILVESIFRYLHVMRNLLAYYVLECVLWACFMKSNIQCKSYMNPNIYYW